jgi:hypothetical protein
MLKPMYHDKRSELLAMLREFVQRESLKEIAAKLFSLMSENELLRLMHRFGNSKSLVASIEWQRLDDLLLFNALNNHTQSVLRFIRDDGMLHTSILTLSEAHQIRVAIEAIAQTPNVHSAGVLLALQNVQQNATQRALLSASRKLLIAVHSTQLIGEEQALLEAVMQRAGIVFEAVFHDEPSHKHKHKKQRRENMLAGWRVNGSVRSLAECIEMVAAKHAELYFIN